VGPLLGVRTNTTRASHVSASAIDGIDLRRLLDRCPDVVASVTPYVQPHHHRLVQQPMFRGQ